MKQRPMPPRPPWEARVVHLGGVRYEVNLHSGGLALTYYGCPPVKWGRARAERWAKRKVDRLNAQEAFERDAEANATVIR